MRLFLVLALVALAGPAAAQSLSLDLGAAGQPGATARLVQLTALIGLLSLAPSLLIMATAFTRIVIVLALLPRVGGGRKDDPDERFRREERARRHATADSDRGSVVASDRH